MIVRSWTWSQWVGFLYTPKKSKDECLLLEKEGAKICPLASPHRCTGERHVAPHAVIEALCGSHLRRTLSWQCQMPDGHVTRSQQIKVLNFWAKWRKMEGKRSENKLKATQRRLETKKPVKGPETTALW